MSGPPLGRSQRHTKMPSRTKAAIWCDTRSRFDGVEINSSFYRPHRLSTYQRWADDVPDHFRFAVKMPKTITHEGRLRDVAEPLQRFLGEIAGLGDKLGPVLIQLPPA